VLQANTIEFSIDENTFVADQFGYGVEKMASSLTPEAAAQIIDNLVQGLSDLLPKIDANLDDREFDQFQARVNDEGKVTDGKLLDSWVDDSKMGSDINQEVKEGTTSVAQKANDRANVIQEVAVSDDDFAGSDFDIKVVDGNIVITNSETGESTTVDLTPEDNPNGDDQIVDQPVEDGVTEDPNMTNADPNVAPVVSDSGAFNPTINLTASAGAPHLTVVVTETAGQDNIASIYTRVPKSSSSLNLPAIPSSTANVLLADGSNLALQLVSGGVPTADQTITMGPRFANVTLSAPVWSGQLKTMGGKAIANFLVYDSGDYYYLATEYLFTSGVSVNGATTTIQTNGVVINAGTDAEISLVSQGGNWVERTDTL
jgi:hypothetical protein